MCYVEYEADFICVHMVYFLKRAKALNEQALKYITPLSID